MKTLLLSYLSTCIPLTTGSPFLALTLHLSRLVRRGWKCAIDLVTSWDNGKIVLYVFQLAGCRWPAPSGPIYRESDEERIRNEKPKCARKQKRRERKRGVEAVPKAWPWSQTSSSTSTYSLQRLQRTGHPTPATWAWAALLDYCWNPEE